MKNKLSDLNNHLFAQLERLSDENLTDEKLQLELERTKAITSVSSEIITNARLVLHAQIAVKEHGISVDPVALLEKTDVRS